MQFEMFPDIFVGGLVAGIVDAIVEAVWAASPDEWRGRFPFLNTIDPLPPLDDWLVLLGSLIVFAAGRGRKNVLVQYVGLGAVLYSSAMVLHHTLVKVISRAIAGKPLIVLA